MERKLVGRAATLLGHKLPKIGSPGFKLQCDLFDDPHRESKTGFWKWRLGVGGDNLVPPVEFVAFFLFAQQNCVLSQYPKSSNRFSDIFKTRARFWPWSPREITNPSLSLKQVGSSSGGYLDPTVSARGAFFFICTRNCAVSEYPKGVNWLSDIFETRTDLWPSSP